MCNPPFPAANGRVKGAPLTDVDYQVGSSSSESARTARVQLL